MMEKQLEKKGARKRPRNRWMDRITSNLEQLGVKDWKRKRHKRKEWSEIVKISKNN